jgi:uncharacterized Zn finger protein (UPF0148 family)
VPSFTCPKCRTPLPIPQPAPEKVACPRCGASIKISAKAAPAAAEPAPATGARAGTATLPRTAAGLVAALREHRILDPAQMEEVAGTLQARYPDPHALARELVQRGWLTAYQAEQLLQGRGSELVLGEYLLLDRLGEGGMGEVFKARHRTTDRVVALKLIRKEALASADAVRRFQCEIRAAAQ